MCKRKFVFVKYMRRYSYAKFGTFISAIRYKYITGFVRACINCLMCCWCVRELSVCQLRASMLTSSRSWSDSRFIATRLCRWLTSSTTCRLLRTSTMVQYDVTVAIFYFNARLSAALDGTLCDIWTMACAFLLLPLPAGADCVNFAEVECIGM